MLEDFREAIRAAASVMRSTAERFDALLARGDLTYDELEAALEAETAELDRAMGTLARELGRE